MPDWINASNFRVTVEGFDEDDSFTYVSEVTSEVEVIEYYHGMDSAVRTGPGRVRYGNVTLHRSYQGLDDRHTWKNNVESGMHDARTVSIEYLRTDGTVLRRYELYGCYPVAWKLPAMSASAGSIGYAMGEDSWSSDDMAIEEMTLFVEKVVQLA